MARKTSTWTVVRTERIARHMVRVVLGDPGFETFEPSEFTDSYVKIEFGWVTTRCSAPTRSGPSTRWHGRSRSTSSSTATTAWPGVAASVQPGATVRLRGPGGAYTPRADADWHLIAGDESGPPAISTAVAALAPDAVAGCSSRSPTSTTRSRCRRGRACRSPGSTAARPRMRQGKTSPGRTRRSCRRSGRCRGCRVTSTSSSTARPTPSCTACVPTSARNTGCPRRRPRSPGTGGAAAPRRASGVWKSELAAAEATAH